MISHCRTDIFAAQFLRELIHAQGKDVQKPT